MALTLKSSVYNSYFVKNGETTVCTLSWKNGSYEIAHNFGFLGIKDGSKLGSFKTPEDALPVVDKIIKSVVKKLS